jgi:CheY-like chemotaxis protein
MQRERVALETVVDRALEGSRPHVNAAGHRLSVLMPAEPAVVEGDAVRLAQVFATLVKNAAKHTPPRGTISLSAALEGAEAVIAVEDSGAGFEPGAAARLFEEAAGVGLRLVQGIVALHGGRIEARSAGRGRGSEFIVRLPLARGAPAEVPHAAARAAPASRHVRVVVADDNRDAADTLQRILSLFGHEVRVAYDGVAAIRLAEEFRPRVAVLDIGMPGTNGYEVARTLRERRSPIKLVALTGWGQESDRRRAMEAGFDYHLTKPVDPEALNRLFADMEKDSSYREG